MLKAIKVRLYLDEEQITYVSKLLGTSRFIYNNLLSYKIKEYNENKHNVNFKELGKKLTSLKNEYEWISEAHSKVLQQSMINMLEAYSNFFKNGNGFPKFKSRKDNKQSCRFPKDAFGNIKGNRLTLIKQLKDIHFKCSKRDEKYLNKYKDKVRSATLTKTKDNKYYLSILIDSYNIKELSKTDKVIGIDLGIKDFIVTSDNTSFENIKIKRNNEKKLAKLHKNLSKKQKGSNNKEKARIKLAKYNDKLNNKKENYLHHIANQLLNENQVIVIENLNVSGMMKNHNLAKSIQELSLNRFINILKYKAIWYDKDIIEIDRYYPSSKLCSNCGTKNNNLTLKDREWNCTSCNTTHNRDYNAAKNILNEGLRILKIGLSSPELTLQESKSLDPQ